MFGRYQFLELNPTDERNMHISDYCLNWYNWTHFLFYFQFLFKSVEFVNVIKWKLLDWFQSLNTSSEAVIYFWVHPVAKTFYPFLSSTHATGQILISNIRIDSTEFPKQKNWLCARETFLPGKLKRSFLSNNEMCPTTYKLGNNWITLIMLEKSILMIPTKFHLFTLRN